MTRRVFFVSDRTGITAEILGRSLLTQFPNLDLTCTSLPFIDTPEKAKSAAARVRDAAEEDGVPPLVFSTFVSPELREILADSGGHEIDLFSTFNETLEHVFGVPSSRTVGRMHGMGDPGAYKRRMDAVAFTLRHDDGIKTNDLNLADVILIGVSRSGKTPTCLYLAMQFYVRAANYPLTDDDLDKVHLPECLRSHRSRLFGLSIDPEQLSLIRQQRRANSPYASLAQCRHEVMRAEALYRREQIPYLHTTTVSVEEIAITLMRDLGLRPILHQR